MRSGNPGTAAYGTLNPPQDSENVSSNYQGSRDGNTPIAGSSSYISGKYASLVKKQPQLESKKKSASTKVVG